MANAGRQYAEGLVGPLDRSHYNTQRDVALRSNETNWQKLTNQYKNLIDRLESDRNRANTQFAEGVSTVSESDFDRTRNAEQNISNRGLQSSGIRNLVEQANTEAKGGEVLKLLDAMGSEAIKGSEQLKKANENLAGQEAKLNADISGVLGEIGAGETQAQMRYNTGVAGLAGSKDARDMENRLAAAQRAASASSRSKSPELSAKEKELDDFYRNVAITSILSGTNPETGEPIDWDDNQKSNALKVLFDVKNPSDVVGRFNKNLKVTDTNAKNKLSYDDTVKTLEEKYGKLNNQTKDTIKKLYEKNQTRKGDFRLQTNNLTNFEGLSNEELNALVSALGTPSPTIGNRGDLSNLLFDKKSVPTNNPINNRESFMRDLNQNKDVIKSNSDYDNLMALNKIKGSVSEDEWERILDAYNISSSTRNELNRTRKTGPKQVDYRDLGILFGN